MTDQRRGSRGLSHTRIPAQRVVFPRHCSKIVTHCGASEKTDKSRVWKHLLTRKTQRRRLLEDVPLGWTDKGCFFFSILMVGWRTVSPRKAIKL
ncbi:hypothetical protein TNIN_153721 [Trichonephila inaurata madagascariensis]|uniref:Uncharacterized protein n=1 Tax=Trichonephila inaurata madagascariensis TaxID=2747483 RepID=A0A8X6WSM2_9ARAC|nr:hypothetical protein TNIN_153721 [Trichonephila inaurata madagascariensis]